MTGPHHSDILIKKHKSILQNISETFLNHYPQSTDSQQ